MNTGLTKRERQVTEREKIIEILDKSKILHLAMVDGDEPYMVPMNYGYRMEGDKLTLYLHCATKGRKLDIIRENPKVFFELECDVQPFTGRVACQYGMAYASLMGSGRAEIIEDVEEKKESLSIFMKSQTGKDFTFDDRKVSIVTIIKIDVLAYTAKCRPLPAALQTELD
ncbi:MAG: pyridoxamine 5'-phosphate oxidase family protein [Lachnospiraceae bacterium]|nr:pyridoxamine 5'-phosphate oxidase family protein [Lachnospiraceae bacterium]